ncbi:Aerobic-type carbon monoxide dehydrogenase, small subunit CoxS/CutS homologs [plant metagenome]|uniref:Aerobic-type carbon monoxide dehydrogenase, small subunit CoxS/CutS homologs n=1 Tax=plant metagenome TaxID=1297885 RepID=A0A484UYH2_9ZZZZ
MDIEQSFTVPYPPEQVWASFQDIEGIVACLPGASLAAPPEGGQLKLGMTVKLGPIVAAFAGDGEMTLDDASRSGRIMGGGSDRKSGSRVKGEAAFALNPATDENGVAGTRVDVRVDYAITGSLAQFSRGGIMREVAQRLTQAFAENLKQCLAAQAEPPVAAKDAAAPVLQSEAAPSGGQPELPGMRVAEPAATAAPAPASASAPPTRPAAPLDLGNLFWSSLWARVRKLFGLGGKSSRT